MDMQDKELDELFGAKLYSFEAEPSKRVWPAIAAGLAAGKRRHLFLPTLSIAASILVLVAAGILLNPTKETVVQKPNTGGGLVKVPVKPVAPPITNPRAVQTALQPNGAANLPVGAIAKTRQKPIHQNENLNNNSTSTALVTPLVIASQPEKRVEQNTLAIVQQPLLGANITTVPDTSAGAMPAIMLPHSDRSAIIANIPVGATQLPLAGVKNITAVKTRHKIHNLGDLLNLAIATVDKRKDKIIEFTNNEDDGSMITAVNLGILKTKRDK
jgi:hypothetical protein